MIDLLQDVVFDKNNIPVLKEDQIEYLALEVISRYDEKIINKAGNVPIGDIIKRLGDKHGVKITGEKLPDDILGYFDRPTNTIIINENTWHPEDSKNNLWRFTIAHELGHFFLHSTLGLAIMQDSRQMFRIFKEPEENNSKDWAEWQANIFAAALLVPKFAFRKHVSDFLKENRLGARIWVDHQEVNKKTFMDIINSISDIFQVSNKVAQIRLEKFNFVEYDNNRKPDGIIEVSNELKWL